MSPPAHPEESDPALAALREALSLSPENVPLRLHVADSLHRAGRSAEAVEEYREVLRRAPDDDRARFALARCYLDQGRISHAAVLAELLVRRAAPRAEAYVLLARVRLREGGLDGARAAFRAAVERDPGLAGSELAHELGLQTVEGPGQDEDDERVALPVGREGEPDDGTGLVGDADFERPLISFADVGGMDEVKEEIAMKVIKPLAHPELFAAYGKKVGGGVLLYGPPGCGKTHLARATAGEAKAAFQSVGLHDVLEMWIGQSERNLHAIFEGARRRRPCVLFFDEVDALGAKRSDMSNAAGRQSINQFLSELDGATGDNEGLLVLAATNAPWHVDAAFRRPGRFDRLIFVPPPDAAARAAILEVLLRGKPCEELDLKSLAKRTERFSGADLKAVVDRAIEAKLRAALQRGAPTPISTKDLLATAKQVRPTTAEWFATAKNHVLFANEGGAYDDVARYMGLDRR
ncbi:MAG TPA: AAA family ATPase [Planctomycetota bacterium]|nr:AAA family ATPase [Planctomycetota bacterium]